MKNGSGLHFLAFVLSLSILTLAVAATSPVTVTIQGPSMPVHLGDPVRIAVAETNVSKTVVHEGKTRGPTSGGLDDIIVLKDSQGKPVAHTELGKSIFRDAGATMLFSMSSTKVELAPGDTLEENITLTDLFEITKAGSYSMIVKRPSPEENNNNYISSNSITIEIVP